MISTSPFSYPHFSHFMKENNDNFYPKILKQFLIPSNILHKNPLFEMPA